MIILETKTGEMNFQLTYTKPSSNKGLKDKAGYTIWIWRKKLRKWARLDGKYEDPSHALHTYFEAISREIEKQIYSIEEGVNT